MSVIRNATLPHQYRDSVVLMDVSRALAAQAGVEDAAVMMGTPANLAVLQDSGLVALGEAATKPDDIVVAVRASDEGAAARAIEWAREHLQEVPSPSHGESSDAADSRAVVYRGWRQLPKGARLALISTPGPYAAAEAWKALRAGLHVFMFSDHVEVADEIALKAAGRERGLLVMGPGCGTALIGGVPLGFSNVVRPGPIGLVAASGSGLQEVICLIDRLGSGVTHAIGTGGRDLSPLVAGAGMRQGMELLARDDLTRVLVLISKPPDPHVAARVLSEAQGIGKPVVACFIGQDVPAAGNVHSAPTLEGAAVAAVALAGVAAVREEDPAVTASSAPGLLRGLFAGGTLAYEAQVVLRDILGPTWSNEPLDPAYRWHGKGFPEDHLCLDLGAEEYTTGQPHPMIDPSRQVEMVVDAMSDDRAGVVLFDMVLGTGSHLTPAAMLAAAISEVTSARPVGSGHPTLVASVTGTDADLQVRQSQIDKLRRVGVMVAPSNASAARTAAHLLRA